MQETFGLKYNFEESSMEKKIKRNYYSINKRAEDFGYRPSLSSIKSILKEAKMIYVN